jgi:adenylate cyclase
MAREVVIERTVECTSEVSQVWEVLADTDWLNRAMGSRPLEVEPLSGSTAARFLMRTRLGGFNVAYEEFPFEWERPHRFSVVRRMRVGPVEQLRMEFFTAPGAQGGTRVTLRLTLRPRLALLALVVRLSAGQSLSRMTQVVKELDEALARGGQRPVLEPLYPPARGALAAAASAMEPHVRLELVQRLVALVEQGGDEVVSRIRPYALADAWGLERREALEACLYAVRAGLLELRWDLVCPSCQTGSATVPTLAEVGEHADCQLCELKFDVNLDESVEATFVPARAVRVVEMGPFCSGGPARTPHVLAQAVLPSGGEVLLAAPAEPGRYRLFVRGGAAMRVEVEPQAPAQVEVDVAALPQEVQVAPSGQLRVRASEGQERHVKLEHLTWVRQAATAREVMLVPNFRRYFSSQLIKPGLALRVARVALLFSDLTGSTELYAGAGDAAAFRLVFDHFDVVTKAMEKHGGTVVKTMGDAVMAAFATDEAALAAAREVLKDFENFRAVAPLHLRTHIKLGIFGGPCYVVSANGVLDYFGQTVNVAARLQGEARSGELVAPATVVDEALAAGRLEPAEVVERYAARLKGVAEPVPVARLRAVGG